MPSKSLLALVSTAPSPASRRLVAFSRNGRGCNARRMAETAAYLLDQDFPPLTVRQWVL